MLAAVLSPSRPRQPSMYFSIMLRRLLKELSCDSPEVRTTTSVLATTTSQTGVKRGDSSCSEALNTVQDIGMVLLYELVMWTFQYLFTYVRM